jgi:hypothetical protein
VLWLLCAAGGVGAAEPAPRFRPVDVFVDAGDASLAAYQIEVVADGETRIVGVEGGEHAAFHEPPRYDPEALRGGRIILAAFNVGTDLPRGRTRVATLHVRESGGAPVAYRATLIVAADSSGHSVQAEPHVIPQEGAPE